METNILTIVVGWLFRILGAAGVFLGLFGFFGQNLIAFSPWILTILGTLFLMSGYGLINRDLDEV